MTLYFTLLKEALPDMISASSGCPLNSISTAFLRRAQGVILPEFGILSTADINPSSDVVTSVAFESDLFLVVMVIPLGLLCPSRSVLGEEARRIILGSTMLKDSAGLDCGSKEDIMA